MGEGGVGTGWCRGDTETKMEQAMHDDFPRAERSGIERLGARIADYVRSRRTDHWIMLLAGLVMGLVVG